ncbi:MAG: multi-sensor signal transduction histidine kinase [Mucilaginibacter sp.]|nr:multi-sensor signal transduction histidine kinase [Mucilaginibacter sp.]
MREAVQNSIPSRLYKDPKNQQINLHFEELVNASPVAIYTCDANGYIAYYNPAAVTLWGREPKIGVDLWCGSWKIYYPDGKPMPLDSCPMARTLKEGKAFEAGEITIERPDHTFRNLLVFPKPIFDDRNKIIGAHNTLVDVTDQKYGEEKQAILSAIVESSDDAIISKTLEGIITSWNAGAEKIFGYTEKEIIGKHISTLIPLSLRAEEDVIIGNIRSGRKVDHFQTVRVHKSGRELQISLTVSPVKDGSGKIIGASKIARDVSESLAAEKKIRQSAERLQILNNIGKVISEKLDVQSILQHVTDATTQITGAAFGAFFYNKIDERGESYTLFTLSGAPREAFEKFGMPRNTAVFEPTFSGKGVIRVADIRLDPRYGHNKPNHGMPEGHLPVVSYLAIPVISSSGTVIGGLFFGHPEAGVFTEEHEDLVSSISSQAAIALDNSKLFEDVKALSAKKDEFIALASHELKTPLTSIKGYLQVLQRTERDHMGKVFITKTLNQVEKLNDLVTDLLDVSRIEAGKLALEKVTFNLVDLVLEVVENLNYTHQSHQILFDSGNAVMIHADRQRIEQVLINLLTNAVKYSPHANQVWVNLQPSENNVTVKVKDQGIGLTTEQQKHIFTRFYRAEGAFNIAGLGLGLYLTREIVERHQGCIGVSSEAGKGSEFYFTIPLN